MKSKDMPRELLMKSYEIQILGKRQIFDTGVQITEYLTNSYLSMNIKKHHDFRSLS